MVELNNPKSIAAQSLHAQEDNMTTTVVSCLWHFCYLYMLYDCAQVVEAIQLPPGQNLASRKELSQRVRRTRVANITQTAPGHPSQNCRSNTDPSFCDVTVLQHIVVQGLEEKEKQPERRGKCVAFDWDGTGGAATGDHGAWGHQWFMMLYNTQWNHLNTHTCVSIKRFQSCCAVNSDKPPSLLHSNQRE